MGTAVDTADFANAQINASIQAEDKIGFMLEMLRIRRFEQVAMKNYHAGKMGGFLHLVKGENAQTLGEDDRERLEVMAGVSAFPMRVKCATLAWHAMKAALEGERLARTE